MNNQKQPLFIKFLKHRCLLLQIIILISIALSQISCRPHTDILTPTENWTYERICNFDDANMVVYSNNPQKRILKSTFIISLLQNSIWHPFNSKEPAQGVMISNAIIEGNVNLASMEISCPIHFMNCEFKSKFVSNDTIFKQPVGFTNCQFDDAIDFQGATFNIVVFHKTKFIDPNATIDFSFLTVNKVFEIEDCIFEGGANFGFANFKKNFSGNKSKFKNKTKPIIFNGMCVEGGAFLNDVNFYGPVNGIKMTISTQLEMQNTKFLSKSGEVIFSQISVNDAVLDDAEFKGPLLFFRSNIKGSLQADRVNFFDAVNFSDTTFNFLSINDSNFNAPNVIVNFDGLTINKDFEISGAKFEGGVTFISTKIGGNFGGQKARFNNKETVVSFNNMQVGNIVSLKNVFFKGPVDATGMQINLQLQLEKTKFLSDKGVNFSQTKISHVLIHDTDFRGPLFFKNSDIKEGLEAYRSQFSNSINFGSSIFGYLDITDSSFNDANSVLYFGFMHVNEYLNFRRTKFNGKVDFSLSEIDGSFICAQTNFMNKNISANFDSMQIQNVTGFGNVFFAGAVSGCGMETDTFFINDSNFINEDKNIYFAGICVKNSVSLVNTIFKGPLSFRGNVIDGNFYINNTKFLSKTGSIDFQNARVGDKVVLRKSEFQGPLELRGFKYNLIETDESNDLCEYMLKLANQAPYSSDVYVTLEDYFIKKGCSEMADKVYVASRRYERKISISSLNWIQNWIIDFLFRYGRKTERVLCIIILPMLCIGTVLFRSKYMVCRNKKENCIRYNPFFYSFDLFLPAINIFWSQDWMPKKEYKYLHAYMIFHKIIGWIFIPLALAAWLGFIK